MTKPITTETSAVASRAADKERAPVEPPVATAPPKPPKRSTITVKTACAKHPDIRQWFVKTIVHLLGRQSNYELFSYFGRADAVQEIIADWVKKTVELRRDEQRFKELLAPYKVTPIPADLREAQTQNVATKIPRIMKAVGPSEFQAVVGTIFEILALENVCSKASLFEARKAVVLAEVELTHALDTWSPFDRLTKVGAKEHPPTPHGPVFTDTNGQQILAARMNVRAKSEVVRQRERLKEHLKALKSEHKYLVAILKDVATIIQKRLAAELDRDRIGEAKFAKAMLQAGYETDFHGKPYADQLDTEKTK